MKLSFINRQQPQNTNENEQQIHNCEIQDEMPSVTTTNLFDEKEYDHPVHHHQFQNAAFRCW